ncbi:MAG TPA: hypothetical protein VN688_06810 [Gemmataceae bacterium]|nr:hypothetical protein [Gemmataceae bacterium]
MMSFIEHDQETIACRLQKCSQGGMVVLERVCHAWQGTDHNIIVRPNRVHGELPDRSGNDTHG